MHKEYKRIIDGADTAVLFIHGILGTPNHFKDFVSLVPQEYSIYNLLLDGHGKGVVEFSHTSMKVWKNQVENAINELLETHRQIIIVAHSMGTLFALQQSYERSREVNGLFLLATPLKINIKLKMFLNSTKLYFNKIKPDDIEALAYKAACGIKQDKKFWLYLGWIPRFLELFKEIKHTRTLIKDILVPCCVFQSKNDEMVSLKSIDLLNNNIFIECNVLQNSSHHYYFENDYKNVLEKYKKFLNNSLLIDNLYESNV